jgi:hypothetical protein
MRKKCVIKMYENALQNIHRKLLQFLVTWCIIHMLFGFYTQKLPHFGGVLFLGGRKWQKVL